MSKLNSFLLNRDRIAGKYLKNIYIFVWNDISNQVMLEIDLYVVVQFWMVSTWVEG